MSGPKVIRVVTREELIATCTTLLSQLDRAIDTWIRECQRLRKLTDAEIVAVKKNRADLASCLINNQFAEIQRRIPDEISYLTKDIEQRRMRAAQAAANAMLISRQQKENAAALLKELHKRSDIIQNDLISQLEQIIAGDIHGDKVEAILSNAFITITTSSDLGLTEEQRKLAKKLIQADDPDAYNNWRKLQNKPINDRLHNIYQQLANIETIIGKDAAFAFKNHLNIIENAEDSNDTNMRIDSLIIDLANTYNAFLAESNLIHVAQEIVCELNNLATSDIDISLIVTEINTTISDKDFSRLPDIITSGRVKLTNFVKQNTANARRTAILTGLSKLGYEVREGMSTILANQGSIIIEKPNTPGYGVEIGGSIDASRLQVRAVAFDDKRDLSRDRDIETLWCNDFIKLKEIFTNQGGGIIIENSHAIGATPLKTVNSITTNGNWQESKKTDQTR